MSHTIGTMTQLLWITISLAICSVSTSFSMPSSHRTTKFQIQQSTQGSCLSLHMIDALFSEPTKTIVKRLPDEVLDENGNKFEVGSIVRVAVDGLKQFQVAPKSLGWFDSNKNFVQDTSTDKTVKKAFLVPVGLRGTVTKIYNIDEVSANFPIQVKFETGKYTEEGYDPPSTFLMHFMSHEIECV